MKVAYILYPEVIISNKSNGIRSQAETWAKILEEKGVHVDLVNNWENYDWSHYDAIHFFGNIPPSVPKRLSCINQKLYYSPIYDPSINDNPILRYLKVLLGKKTNGILKTSEYIDDIPYKYFHKIFVRSQFELNYLACRHGIPKSKFALVPLSFTPNYANYSFDMDLKEDFCLHISSIFQSRKNVLRLIQAAKTYNFKLILAGNKGTEAQFAPIKEAIGDSKNIQVLGFITEEEKISLYQRARVFALPSLTEGVGIVAVDAALLGCEIVITNIPGPKEYYDGNCIEVDPCSVSQIGNAIDTLLKGERKFQPNLSNNIKNKYAPNIIVDFLIEAYKN